ncbi:EAL domain, c-di-GMP-specific phosphodiesterase class I (or its enzymatically inactive variant) [Parasphingorhabdus marina DSM 22363]|uniref:EAL domain, c-di-GMP-specific phosphodiesterase class I (Or its enzymatically inactive variant) n=1 Tax=Parasphingorhabdus marina DSM 22363 TaxID=1123272 RepID=A0A1N6EGN7_9SPHN|nr:EAL domain-containing protein [Parasphingorhabdus marina]SIN82159.1 EAL domain, c-di-GMP-specific phosphodiesterase class I (or its enzymatically inactive variant) [Parasphingorhabdus marina DSM 22363]
MKSVLSIFSPKNIQRPIAAWILALMTATALAVSGIGGNVERQLRDMRAGLMDRPATGDLVIVEIDAKSIQAMERWPWPRTNYAQVVDRLSAAGISQIAFDVDFSSSSVPAQDAIFAEALARSDTAILLPTFKQAASSTSSEYRESLPIESLRAHAFLASVNVHPGRNGQLNDYSYGTITGGEVRPSLASMIAESSGAIGEKFMIDQSINPATIPARSFVDMLDHTTDLSELRGKKVLIGATAIELGDRYPISRFGVVPGVVIQALAAETLMQQRNIPYYGFIPALLVAALVILAVTGNHFSTSQRNIATLATGFALFGALLASEFLGWITWSNFPAFLFLGIFLLSSQLFSLNIDLDQSRFVDRVSFLPNEAAMRKEMPEGERNLVAVARLLDLRELLAVTTDHSRQSLFSSLADRLRFLARDEQIYHVDSDIIAWIVKQDYVEDVAGHFDTATALFQAPVKAGDANIRLSATFGVSEGSIDQAKVAADHAKETGRRWAWHDAEVDTAISRKQNLLAELDTALEKGQIWTVYQPKWDIPLDRLDGAEALVRWTHPERGNISPDIFIPILEKADRIADLTLYVLDRALRDFSRFDAERPGLVCSVNISAQLLHDPDFINDAIARVGLASLDNSQVVFEVTETAALEDMEASIAALEKIRAAGIRISIDDYGTGQSTMSYLQKLPVDEIKIDQSFVRTLTTDRANALMVRSTVELAHGLGLKVVAEGIEDRECMNQLREYGCDVGQGWFVSKPVTADSFNSRWIQAEAGLTGKRAASG